MKSALVALLLGSSASAFTIGQRAVLRRPTGRASTTMKAHDQTPVATGPALALAALLAAGAASPLAASANEVVGSIPASGFIFKVRHNHHHHHPPPPPPTTTHHPPPPTTTHQDTLDITRFADPKVSGVSLYVSDFSKPITERLGVSAPRAKPTHRPRRHYQSHRRRHSQATRWPPPLPLEPTTR